MGVAQGLYLLIQSGITSISPLPPGFAVQLPENQLSSTAPMAWSYRSITSTPTYTLAGQVSFTSWTVQIDSHGLTMAYAEQLAGAIDGVLRGGWSGTMSDPDSTVVNGIFRKSTFVDGFRDENKSFVRSIDYCVQFYQQ
jgi:hypothetical protein